MTADRARPLLAYALVALACTAVLVQGLRTDAVRDLVTQGPQASPGTRLGAVHGTVLTPRSSNAPASAPATVEPDRSRPPEATTGHAVPAVATGTQGTGAAKPAKHSTSATPSPTTKAKQGATPAAAVLRRGKGHAHGQTKQVAQEPGETGATTRTTTPDSETDKPTKGRGHQH